MFSTVLPNSAAPYIHALVVMPLAEQRGGAELTLLHLVEHGRNSGVRWSVAFLSDGPMVKAIGDYAVSVFVIPSGRMRQPHRIATTVMRLRSLIQEQCVDIVLSWMGKGQLYGGSAAALAGVPATWFQHGLPDPPGWQDRLATWLPARLVLTCSATVAAAQAKLRPHRPTVVVHPGVDLVRFNPANLPSPAVCRQKYGLPIDGPLIGIVGRLQRWKGMHHLVDAMPAVLKAHANAYAVIIGGEHDFEPDYATFLNARISALGLEDRVLQVGLQSNIPEWMQAMDVIVHASDAEPFGMVVLEAMALAKPIIAADTAGPSEIITDGFNGYLWRVGDVDSLSSLIKILLNSGKIAPSVCTNARIRASEFSADLFAAGVCQNLSTTIERSRKKANSQEKNRNATQPEIRYLEGLRGAAALAVVLCHSVNHSMVFVPMSGWQSVFQKTAEWLFQGRVSVAIFIVLSGYLLMRPTLPLNGKLRGGARQYLFRRARRILPPYYAALVASLCLLLLVPKLRNGFEDIEWSSALPALTAKAILSHLLLIHNLSASTALKINGPMWSIATEWQLYFVFPFILLPLWRKWGSLACIITGLGAGLGLYFLTGRGGSSCPWFVGLFAMGMAAAANQNSVTNPRQIRALGILGLSLFGGYMLATGGIAAGWWGPNGGVEAIYPYYWVGDCIIGAATSLFLVYANRIGARSLLVRLLSIRILVILGVASYSLYLIHDPVLAAVRSILVGFSLSPIENFIATIVVGIPIALLATALLHIVVERRFMDARRVRQV